MGGKKVTVWGILIAIAALLGLEIWTLTNDKPNDTISEVIQDKSRDWLFIPFLFGFLMGHWFWPLYKGRHNVSE